MTIHETDYLFGVRVPFSKRKINPIKSYPVVERSVPLYLDFSSNSSVTRKILTIIHPDTILLETNSRRVGGVVFKSENGQLQNKPEKISKDQINDMKKVSGWIVPFFQRRFSWKR